MANKHKALRRNGPEIECLLLATADSLLGDMRSDGRFIQPYLQVL
jgi:hypothetical protein